jgi:hypothetical protein
MRFHSSFTRCAIRRHAEGPDGYGNRTVCAFCCTGAPQEVLALETAPGLRITSALSSFVWYTFRFTTRFSYSQVFYPYMLFSKEYVGYLAREVTKKLIAGKFIETDKVPTVTERVNAALVDELSLEDRINDEVRVILEAYSDEMRNTGANYQEMFRKVKSELVRKYKAVL